MCIVDWILGMWCAVVELWDVYCRRGVVCGCVCGCVWVCVCVCVCGGVGVCGCVCVCVCAENTFLCVIHFISYNIGLERSDMTP